MANRALLSLLVGASVSLASTRAYAASPDTPRAPPILSPASPLAAHGTAPSSASEGTHDVVRPNALRALGAPVERYQLDVTRLRLGALANPRGAGTISRDASAFGGEEPSVPVIVSAPGEAVLRGTGPLSDVSVSCSSPCTVHLIPGVYQYSGGGLKDETVAFTGPSRLELVPPTQPLHTASLIVVGVGVFGAVVPLITVFGTCASSTDDVGRRVEGRCLDFSRGADLVLTIIAGGGLSLVALGGVLYLLSGGGLTVTDLDPGAISPRNALAATRSRPLVQLDLAHGQLVF